jgi:hypothetical protein
MLTGIAALEHTDWSRLYHAYGRATDTPGHLRSLLREDLEPREQAMEHLFSAVIHQGSPWTATGPAALVVAGLLSDERIDRDEPTRANLLSFLVSVAEAVAEGPEQAGLSIEELERLAAFDIETLLDSEIIKDLSVEYARAILGCIQVAPILMKVMLEGLAHSSPFVRALAAKGAVTLTKTESLRSYAKDLESRLLALARAAQNSDERSAHVLSLGDLGFSPIDFFEDRSPAVRMCAALAPSLAANPVAINELLNALEQHAGEIDDWFVDEPPQFPWRPRFSVVARLIQQVKDFDRLVNAAIALVSVTTKYCVDFDWGPLLTAAFSDGSGIIKTEAQRQFLGALVKKSELWDPMFGNADKWFKKAGLPYDRQSCSRRLKEA